MSADFAHELKQTDGDELEQERSRTLRARIVLALGPATMVGGAAAAGSTPSHLPQQHPHQQQLRVRRQQPQPYLQHLLRRASLWKQCETLHAEIRGGNHEPHQPRRLSPRPHPHLGQGRRRPHPRHTPIVRHRRTPPPKGTQSTQKQTR